MALTAAITSTAVIIFRRHVVEMRVREERSRSQLPDDGCFEVSVPKWCDAADTCGAHSNPKIEHPPFFTLVSSRSRVVTLQSLLLTSSSAIEFSFTLLPRLSIAFCLSTMEERRT